jgi:hypothetical protein
MLAIERCGSGLLKEAKDCCQQDDLQLLLNHQAMSTLGVLPTTLKGAHMQDSELTNVEVALTRRTQWFVPRLANTTQGSKLKQCYKYPTLGIPLGTVATMEHKCGRRAQTMHWSNHGEKPAGKETMIEDDT